MFVKTDKEDFVGKESLARMEADGVPRRLYGCRMIDKGVAREGYPVYMTDGDTPVGRVTSGSRSPLLEAFIALLLLEKGVVKVGDVVEIDVHGKRKKAEIVKTPF